MKIVCISDTHSLHDKINLPDGDILIHSGDMTGMGGLEEVKEFNRWLASVSTKYAKILVIAGNHDWLFQNKSRLAKSVLCKDIPNITYLENSSIEFNGIKFWGSPITPTFYNWAFNVDRGPWIKEIWDKISDDTNVLITHGPPFGILDEVPKVNQSGSLVGFSSQGCEDLLRKIKSLPKLKLHVFGHIHEGYGSLEERGIKYINASSCNDRYKPINKPIVIEI